MPENNYLLSISTSADGAEVNVHANAEGLKFLEREIKMLREQLEKGECPHAHLMSPSWGDDALSESMFDSELDAGCRQVNHVKLYAWTPEWQKKNGL